MATDRNIIEINRGSSEVHRMMKEGRLRLIDDPWCNKRKIVHSSEFDNVIPFVLVEQPILE